MTEEKKELSTEEEEKATEEQEEKSEGAAEEEKEEVKSEEEKSEEGFKKEGEELDHNAFNQALRKAREAEAEKRELAKRLEELEKAKAQPAPKPEPKKEEKKEEKEKADFWEEGDEEEEQKEEEEKSEAPDVMTEVEKLVEEKMKPFHAAQETAAKKEKEDQRTVFFEKNPQYLKDSRLWQDLLDEMDTSINPNAGTYYDQLEKAHLIVSGTKAIKQPAIEKKKMELANDASAGGGKSAGGSDVDADGLTAEDRKIMRDNGVSLEGMKAFKEKQKSGSMTLMY